MPEVINNTLYVMTPGTSLHLDHDAVRVYHPDREATRLPLIRIDHVVAFGGVTVTDDLLHRCAADQRSVTWLSGNGRFKGRVVGPQGGNPLLRVAQHDAFRDQARRLATARCFVAGKIHNTRQVLLKAAADASGGRQEALRKTAADIAEDLPTLDSTDNINVILGVEGQTAKRYIAQWRNLINDHSQVPAPAGRTTRPPQDPVNAALSFGYGMLRVAVHGALEQVGLDPYIGYLHGIRPGKPALALDLMEEMRTLLVDRLVFTALNRRQLKEKHFSEHLGGAYELTEDGRRTYLALWSEGRRREWPHRHLGRGVPAATIPILQARLLSRYLRGDLAQYVPWSPA
ncbi:MAG: type I-C CRISPR-associated endonuclease Cas1 [Dactylosporangium sp.]|nr:type I-C CRISPR-associated endonuclease Cas1c [Dactylosporangium sp.]NNJ61515.1 type I-C CRISPR-associated endonuclease Cas1 [Dactylosporangium sp.]